MAHINRASFGLLSRVLFLFFQAATTAHQFVPKQLFSILLENKQLFWVASVVAWGKSRKVSASVLEMKINRLHFSVLFSCSPAPPQCFPFSGPDPANVALSPLKSVGLTDLIGYWKPNPEMASIWSCCAHAWWQTPLGLTRSHLSGSHAARSVCPDQWGNVPACCCCLVYN